MSSVLEVKIFQYGFLEENKMCVTVIDPQRGEMNSPLWRLNEEFWWPGKKC